jgi:hypothetical protein
LGEVAFSSRFGFLDTGTDVENVIKIIDDIQWYDGIVGQIPNMDKFLRQNPIWKILPSQGPPIITRVALQELAKRKKLGSKETDRRDLLSRLLVAHEQRPDEFGEGDVFAVAHGAM